MNSRITIVVLISFFVVCWSVVFGAGARPKNKNLLYDGFVLMGVDGKLIGADSNGVPEKWFFELDSGLSDGSKSQIAAGTRLEFLPSSALEGMIADMAGYPEAHYRLWGKLTRYQDKNFIFAVYFLPVSDKQPQPQEAQPGVRPAINDPNDTLTIPKEVMDRLLTKKVIRPEQLRKGLELKTDYILADRTGFIVKQKDSSLVFAPDALGWNIQKVSLRLLPSQILELSQQEQSKDPEQLRFEVAGIVTEFEGRYYLLLQRAIRMYSCGNFEGGS